MDRLGEQFLAGAAGAVNQDTRLAAGNLLDCLQDAAQGRRTADDRFSVEDVVGGRFERWCGPRQGCVASVRKLSLDDRNSAFLFGNCFDLVLKLVVQTSDVPVHSCTVQRNAGDLSQGTQKRQVFGSVGCFIRFAAQCDKHAETAVEFEAVKEFGREGLHHRPSRAGFGLRSALSRAKDVGVGLQLLDRFRFENDLQRDLTVWSASHSCQSECVGLLFEQVDGRRADLEHVVTGSKHSVSQGLGVADPHHRLVDPFHCRVQTVLLAEKSAVDHLLNSATQPQQN